MPGPSRPRSVLDDLGEEITGIAAPVSICMALVVLLVRALNPDGQADPSTVSIATLAYHEQDTDSTGQKLAGALLNALIFVAVIAGMTFVLFLLFKWGCYKLIYGYMGFAMLNVFFFFTGALVVQLLRLIGLHVDLFSLAFLLFNFSVLGILSLFFMPVPLLLKQCYTVWVGVCVAYIFTHIPEWTSWVLLVAMALYDLAAVLMPGGPLKILVELAIERQQELPALIYESRPVGRPYQRGMWRRPAAEPAGGPAGNGGVQAAAASLLAGGGGDASPHRVALLAGQPRSSADELCQEMSSSPRHSRGGQGAVPLAEAREEEQQLPGQQQEQAAGGPAGGSGAAAAGSSRSGSSSQVAVVPAAAAPVPAMAVPRGDGAAIPLMPVLPGGVAAAAAGEAEASEDEESLGLPDGIKLGLGDFIFYSMLVGRAAMFDMMTVYASYIAVISGLGITLLLLALARKALPALPVSIALGVMFYFLTRLVMEPFVVPVALNLAYY